MKIYNSTQNKLISDKVKVADNIVSRSIGLLGRKNINIDECLLIKPCNSIHTFFMQFAIDVIFINSKKEVIAIYENVKPFKILPIHITSNCVLELKAAEVSKKGIKKGDKLIFD